MLKDIKLRFLALYGHRAVLDALFKCHATTVTTEVIDWLKLRYEANTYHVGLEHKYRLLLERYPCDYVAEASKVVLRGGQLTQLGQLEEIGRYITHKLTHKPIDLSSILGE